MSELLGIPRAIALAGIDHSALNFDFDLELVPTLE